MNKHPHNWSGWPGAHCLDCGQGQWLENAIGDGWYDPFEDKWDSEDHRKMVELCDGFCRAKMTAQEIEEHKAAIEKMKSETDYSEVFN